MVLPFLMFIKYDFGCWLSRVAPDMVALRYSVAKMN